MERLCLVASCVDVDIVKHPGRGEHTALGGAGLYAYSGMRVFSNSSSLVCNISSSCLAKYEEWFYANDVDMSGLKIVSMENNTVVDYCDEDDRTDVPLSGLCNKRLLNPSLEDISSMCSDSVRGIYVFRHLDGSYLEDLAEFAGKRKILVMWEIASDAAVNGNLHEVVCLMERLGAFSINMKEAFSLLNAEKKDEVVSFFKKFEDTYVYLRDGASGAYVLHGGRSVFCPSVPGCIPVDTTGCGNASTGAFLQAVCRNKDIETAGHEGSYAASMILRQYGPPELF